MKKPARVETLGRAVGGSMSARPKHAWAGSEDEELSGSAERAMVAGGTKPDDPSPISGVTTKPRGWFQYKPLDERVKSGRIIL